MFGKSYKTFYWLKLFYFCFSRGYVRTKTIKFSQNFFAKLFYFTCNHFLRYGLTVVVNIITTRDIYRWQRTNLSLVSTLTTGWWRWRSSLTMTSLHRSSPNTRWRRVHWAPPVTVTLNRSSPAILPPRVT